jgi:hypothetical protein
VLTRTNDRDAARLASLLRRIELVLPRQESKQDAFQSPLVLYSRSRPRGCPSPPSSATRLALSSRTDLRPMWSFAVACAFLHGNRPPEVRKVTFECSIRSGFVRQHARMQTSLQWLLFDQQYVTPVDNVNSGASFHDGVQRWDACRWLHDDIEGEAPAVVRRESHLEIPGWASG